MPKAIKATESPSVAAAGKSYEIRAEAQRVEEARMSKLTEIKEIVRLTEIDRKGEEGRLINDMRYLLSLLEEKEKALEGVLSIFSFHNDWVSIDIDGMTYGFDDEYDVKVFAARTALNTTKEEDQ